MSHATLAQLEQVTGLGKTPLHIAAKGGNAEVVKAFIEAGADLNQRTRSEGDSAKLTPLYLAASQFERISRYDVIAREVAKVLVDAGANIDANSAILMNDNERLKELIAEDPSLEHLALDRDLLFANAATVGNTPAMKILLEHGFRPNAAGLFAAIEVTINQKNDPSSTEGLKLLLEAGGVEHLHTEVKNYPVTPYEYASTFASGPNDSIAMLELVEKHNPRTS